MSRLAASLVVAEQQAFTTLKYQKHVYAGEPSNITRIFSDLWADEIFVLGVDANPNPLDFGLLQRISSQTFVPLSYGGGIRTVEQAEKVSRSGFEKVVVETAVTSEPRLVSQIASSLGSSSVVASFSFNVGNWISWRSKEPLKTDLLDTLDEVQAQGAGEIKINAIDRDGTLLGPDFELIESIVPRVRMPLIYQGGVSSMSDAQRLWDLGVDCVTASTWFTVRPPHNAVLVTFPNRGKRA